jgi:hypothetical protein
MRGVGAVAAEVPTISNAHQFREALARLRMLEKAADGSPERRERAQLELAVSRFLAEAPSKPCKS